MTTMDNDHEILSTLNINNILYNYYNFKGCYAADNIPIIKPAENEINGFIINTAKYGSPGEHWTAIIIKNNSCIFFYSFGCEIYNQTLLSLLKSIQINKYMYNSIQIQPFLSNNCGYYCIAFILSQLKDFSYTEFMNIFSYDREKNNNTCYNFIKMYI